MIIMRLDGDLCDQSSTRPNIALIIYGLMRCRNSSWGRVRDSLGSSSTVHIVNLQKRRVIISDEFRSDLIRVINVRGKVEKI